MARMGRILTISKGAGQVIVWVDRKMQINILSKLSGSTQKVLGQLFNTVNNPA
jgi:hypothetical protein